MTHRPAWASALIYGFLTVTSFVILYPLAVLPAAAFTTPDQYLRTTVLPVPNLADFRNYRPVLTDCAQGACVGPAIVVTTVRALWYIFWALLVSILGGY